MNENWTVDEKKTNSNKKRMEKTLKKEKDLEI